VKFEYVLTNNSFGGEKNMEFIYYDMKKKFTIRLKSNPIVALPENDREKGLCF